MSATAWGKLLVGYRFPEEPLRVPDGKHWECQNYPSHDTLGSHAHCPSCGGRVHEVDTMVPSPLVANFAETRGIPIEKALEILKPYQHQLPDHWNDYKGGWVFGAEVVPEVGSNRWTKVTPVAPLGVLDLLVEAGMPVNGHAFYMAVWLD